MKLTKMTELVSKKPLLRLNLLVPVGQEQPLASPGQDKTNIVWTRLVGLVEALTLCFCVVVTTNTGYKKCVRYIVLQNRKTSLATFCLSQNI